MKTFLLMLSVVLGVVSCLAQSTEPPAPAVAGVNDADNTPPPRYEDNVRPLSGVQNFDVGTRTDRINVLVPALTMSGSYGTNPGYSYGSQGQTVWGATTNLGGSLQMERGNVSNLFSMSYLGSGQLNSYNSDLNTQVHSLGLKQSITAGRWNFVLGDTFAYQPNAYASYPTLLFPGINTGNPDNFRPGTGPNNTVLTSQNTQISNTGLGQATYGLTRASSITGNFSYGILHYLEGNLLDSQQLNATGGFDHRFGHDSMGVSYTYSRFMYDNVDETFDTNTIHLTYGHRVIGRFSIALEAGPTFRNIQSGGTSVRDVDVSGAASLHYTGNRSGFGLSYIRAVTGGSGVTVGAVTDSVSVSADRKITRFFSGNANAGYSLNSGITGAQTEYKTLFFGAGISRSVSRYLTFAVGYRGQRQTSDNASANFTSHAAVVSMQWQFRPIRLQ